VNPGKRKYKLEDLYAIACLSRQGHHKYMQSRVKEEAEVQLTISSVMEIRAMHKNIGLGKIYKIISPDWIGRDRFLSIGVEHGLAIKQHKSFRRTTYSTKSAWFTNLVSGLVLDGINQVWVSDITYYRVVDIFYYLTFIEDVYSRKILGWTASRNLRAEANCKALRMALADRKLADLKCLIHHSDRGTQYASNEYLRILADNKIAVSMCDNVYENTHIERVNGRIKNDYLRFEDIKTFEQLEKELDIAVRKYNNLIHGSLGFLSPIDFEKKLGEIPKMDRILMRLYKNDKKIYVQQSFF